MTEPLTFADWLRLQANRDDVVGDVANEFLEDVRRGCARGISSPASFLGHIADHHGDSLSISRGPVTEAITEWEGGDRDDD